MKGIVVVALSFWIVCNTLIPQSHKAPENTPAMRLQFGHGTPPLSPLLDMDHNSFQVAPVKGHWTLLYFWADWCVPCVQKGIPELIDFTKVHTAEQDRFRIIAIRFGSTHEDFEWKDFRERTLKLERNTWHQVPIFPIVDDDSSRFSTDWGIHELPTYALIDPNGNLVADGDLITLAAKLGPVH